MKVAYLLGSLNRGGTETLLLDVFRNAKLNKLNAIGIYRKGGVLEKEFKESGVEMFQLSVGHGLLAYILSLRKLLKDNGISIAHAQQPLDALYAWLACIGTGIKVLLTFHGYDFANNRSTNAILRFIIKRTDVSIFVSDTQRYYYQEKYGLKPNKQKLVYNGISFDKLDVPNTRGTASSLNPSIRSELNLSSDTLLLGTVGNFVSGRDQMTICRFLKLLNEQEVDFHFVFAGKKVESLPELYDNCTGFCQDNGLSEIVSFLGSRNDVPQILNELDAFIYSTNHDTFGIAVVEAMYAGIPVFVNDWEVMREVTEEGRLATLYPTKDAQALMTIFQGFMDNKTDFQKKAQLASDTVKQKYSIEKHIEELMEIYGGTCDSK